MGILNDKEANYLYLDFKCQGCHTKACFTVIKSILLQSNLYWRLVAISLILGVCVCIGLLTSLHHFFPHSLSVYCLDTCIVWLSDASTRVAKDRQTLCNLSVQTTVHCRWAVAWATRHAHANRYIQQSVYIVQKGGKPSEKCSHVAIFSNNETLALCSIHELKLYNLFSLSVPIYLPLCDWKVQTWTTDWRKNNI